MSLPTRILFITPSLEPGRDGVGDYARRVGGGLRERGWEVSWVALNDSYVDTECRSKDGSMLRLPAAARLSERATALSRFVEMGSFDWISLQWVGFGYERRGLPWRWIEPIERVRSGGRLHVYFHEIWLGEKPGLATRQRILGKLQKRLMLKAVRRWEPDLIHTSNRLYLEALNRAGVSSDILRLPGNIPLAADPDGHIPGPARDAFRRAGDRALRIALFGSLDAEWNPMPVLEALAECSENLDRNILLLAIGNQGSGAENWRRACEAFLAPRRLTIATVGPCGPEEASRMFQRCDFGATTKSYFLLGKSGAFGALSEHGLPVIALRSPAESDHSNDRDDFIVPVFRFVPEKASALAQWLDTTPRQKPWERLPQILDVFEDSLLRVPSTRSRS